MSNKFDIPKFMFQDNRKVKKAFSISFDKREGSELTISKKRRIVCRALNLKTRWCQNTTL